MIKLKSRWLACLLHLVNVKFGIVNSVWACHDPGHNCEHYCLLDVHIQLWETSHIITYLELKWKINDNQWSNFMIDLLFGLNKEIFEPELQICTCQMKYIHNLQEKRIIYIQNPPQPNKVSTSHIWTNTFIHWHLIH